MPRIDLSGIQICVELITKYYFQRITQLQKTQSFAVHLACFISQSKIQNQIRVIAGHTLKGYIEKYYAFIPVQHLNFIQLKIQQSFQQLEQQQSSNSYQIMKAVSNIICIIVERGGVGCWPNLLPFLLSKLMNKNTLQLALKTIRYICEDCGESIYNSASSASSFTNKKSIKIADQLWQNLYKILEENHQQAPVKIKEDILVVLSLMLWNPTARIIEQMENYLSFILNLYKVDQNSSVRREIFRTLSIFLVRREDLIQKYSDTIYPTIIQGMSEDRQTEEALAACDFWPEFFSGADQDDFSRFNSMGNEYFQQLLMKLIQNCVFKEADMIDFMPDQDSFGNDQDNLNPEQSDDDDDNGNQKQSTVSPGLKHWTIRRCSAYILERISGKLIILIDYKFSYIWWQNIRPHKKLHLISMCFVKPQSITKVSIH